MSGADQKVTRSNRAVVRNPILAMPSIDELRAMPESHQVARLLRDIALDARGRADKCWRTHKAPMAAYWKAVSVYAGHIARALSREPLS